MGIYFMFWMFFKSIGFCFSAVPNYKDIILLEKTVYRGKSYGLFWDNK